MHPKIRSTTILCVRRNNHVAIGGDGQVTLGDTAVKSNAVKVRQLADGKVLAGIAGGAADALTLFELFEVEIGKRHQLQRAAVEVARLWRTERALRPLDALMIVADREKIFMLSGKGDLIEPDEGILAIGSGGTIAHAAARVLMQETKHNAADIVNKALTTAADMCIYTNHKITLQELK
jgi:ATP-dependent HslUV protease subunit HslV